MLLVQQARQRLQCLKVNAWPSSSFLFPSNKMPPPRISMSLYPMPDHIPGLFNPPPRSFQICPFVPISGLCRSWVQHHLVRSSVMSTLQVSLPISSPCSNHHVADTVNFPSHLVILYAKLFKSSHYHWNKGLNSSEWHSKLSIIWLFPICPNSFLVSPSSYFKL